MAPTSSRGDDQPCHSLRIVVHGLSANCTTTDCLAERAEGRQVWVYTTMTDTRDVCERLRIRMMCRGLRVMILRSHEVPPKERGEWIAKWGPQCDVIISHPKLVETGVDLFCKRGNHNFCTLWWFLTGFSTFTLRQASSRHFRIGQGKECRTKYGFYTGTMQERAMMLMGQKLSASQALEGRFSTEGLVAMSGEDGGTIEMELAKSLLDRVSVDATRAWDKISSASIPPMTSEEMESPAESVRNNTPRPRMSSANPFRSVEPGRLFDPSGQLVLF